MPYGRGGAGNILQAKEESKKVAEDVEANRASSTPSTTQPTSQPPSEYAHMGRGGAGNWFQPKELQKDGTFTQPTDSTAIPTSSTPQVSKPWHPEGQELPVARSGRGGAGNFVWRSEEEIRREKEGRELDELKKKESVRESVEKGVEEVLARPGKVVVSGEGGRTRGW
ncbi:hypothetical protein FB567DRAFT_530835 [Paraphoma chrysanthemicola]|uniref:Uncharacterized protein n=1 Tax=Paraphoma chrysanthemicola TaxID=798071 RepID=A0A8K0R0V4_9PLEO|nr:hypothetical protein FB567DRAFT_530835 [Paraphoma chrysanthemicola]